MPGLSNRKQIHESVAEMIARAKAEVEPKPEPEIEYWYVSVWICNGTGAEFEFRDIGTGWNNKAHAEHYLAEIKANHPDLEFELKGDV